MIIEEDDTMSMERVWQTVVRVRVVRLDYQVVGVFTTKQAAEACVGRLHLGNPSNGVHIDITEVNLDEEIPQ